MNQQQTADTDSVSSTDLTAFQMEALLQIARLQDSDSDCYGLAIKRALEERIGADVNHGRLYPNLDELTDWGLVDKSEIDKRTNEYALTADGVDLLKNRSQYVSESIEPLE